MEQYNEKIGTRKDLVSYRIETAKSDLKSAKILLNAGEYKGANNRAYYAIFHAINAVHALDGRAFKRHKDAIANFNKDYVKTEIFPREANVHVTAESSAELAEAVRSTIKKLCDVLGIITEREEELLDEDIEKLIEERQAARKAKNFARADEIRDQLASQGILLEDTREGVKWKRA